MTLLKRAFYEEAGRTSATNRVALLDGATLPIQAGDPDSIVAGLPGITMDYLRPPAGARPRHLRVENGGRSVTLMSRVGPAPEGADWLRLQVARDRQKREVPLCGAEAREGRLVMLLELDRARIVRAELPEGESPQRFVAQCLIERPVRALLNHLRKGSARTWVGKNVAHQVGAHVARRHPKQEVLFRELGLLQSIATGRLARSAIARHLHALHHALRGQNEKPEPAGSDAEPAGSDAEPEGGLKVERSPVSASDVEVARLVRLLRDRACVALKLQPDRIVGLLGPRLLTEQLMLQAVMFRLLVSRPGRPPRLQCWNPVRPKATPRQLCIDGDAEDAIYWMQNRGDIYGLVDVVLNYMETNGIGAIGAGLGVPLGLSSSHNRGF